MAKGIPAPQPAVRVHPNPLAGMNKVPLQQAMQMLNAPVQPPAAPPVIVVPPPRSMTNE